MTRGRQCWNSSCSKRSQKRFGYSSLVVCQFM